MWRQGWQQVLRESAGIGLCISGGKGHRQGHGRYCPLPLPAPATQSLQDLIPPHTTSTHLTPPAPQLPTPKSSPAPAPGYSAPHPGHMLGMVDRILRQSWVYTLSVTLQESRYPWEGILQTKLNPKLVDFKIERLFRRA